MHGNRGERLRKVPEFNRRADPVGILAFQQATVRRSAVRVVWDVSSTTSEGVRILE
jgi:hypothetical protein